MSTSNFNSIVTGSAGFIGFHLCQRLLNEGFNVIGIDSLSNYYDVKLKIDRNSILKKNIKYKFYNFDITDHGKLKKIFLNHSPKYVFHLAAQAGVRYSLKHPRSYIDSNIIGSFNILESCKETNIKHLIMASTSSVYGMNDTTPFSESDKADTQLTTYSASKKAMESLSHSYSYLWKIPITILRFFTVYGPWGRPDLALFKFVKAIKDDSPIEIYNKGKMSRDFTYIDDLVESIYRLIPFEPTISTKNHVPYQLLNIGNSKRINLMDFISAIENNLGITAKKKFLEMQIGDVRETWADCKKLEEIINFKPNTEVTDGIKKFIEWYNNYYENFENTNAK